MKNYMAMNISQLVESKAELMIGGTATQTAAQTFRMATIFFG
jgi:hypothetical protein